MKAYKNQGVPMKCKNHPEVIAVRDSLCDSCLGYRELGDTIHGRKPPASPPPK